MRIRRGWRGISAVGWLNILLFQWLCFRLEVSVEDAESMEIVGARLIGPVLPLTGWWSDYRWMLRGEHGLRLFGRTAP